MYAYSGKQREERKKRAENNQICYLWILVIPRVENKLVFPVV